MLKIKIKESPFPLKQCISPYKPAISTGWSLIIVGFHQITGWGYCNKWENLNFFAAVAFDWYKCVGSRRKRCNFHSCLRWGTTFNHSLQPTYIHLHSRHWCYRSAMVITLFTSTLLCKKTHTHTLVLLWLQWITRKPTLCIFMPDRCFF